MNSLLDANALGALADTLNPPNLEAFPEFSKYLAKTAKQRAYQKLKQDQKRDRVADTRAKQKKARRAKAKSGANRKGKK